MLVSDTRRMKQEAGPSTVALGRSAHASGTSHADSRFMYLITRLSLSTALALLATAGCARQLTPPMPAEPPHISSAALDPPAKMPVSPGITVSPEIATACKLTISNIENAPRFPFDASALDSQDNAALGQIATCLTTGPLAGRVLELIGRADPRGGTDYNLALGGRRASSVAEYLMTLGVESDHMLQTSRGKSDATGTNEEGWKLDRRVDLQLR